MDLDFQELSKSKPFIAIPSIDGKMESETVRGLLDFQAICYSSGIENEFSFTTGDALITRARNKLVAQFMTGDCTHLVFIDADVGFDGSDILKLMVFMGRGVPETNFRTAFDLLTYTAKHNPPVVCVRNACPQ